MEIKKNEISISFPILTGQEASGWDEFSIKEKGINSSLLMGWAGYSAFLFLLNQEWFNKASHIHFLCGSGNNGGDGYVIAWHILSSTRKNITIWNSGNPSSSDSLYFYNLCKKFAEDSKNQKHVVFQPLEKISHTDLKENQIIIDSLFGTGLNKPLSDEIQNILKRINSAADCIRIAVDIPSGVYSDGSSFNHTVFLADYTISFGSYKIGQLTEPGINFCGQTIVFPIGFYPREIHYNNRRLAEKINIPALRKSSGHKYDSGVLKILGGSEGMEGAAILSSMAFLSLGGGLAKIYSLSSKINNVLSDHPELMIQTKENIELLTEFFSNSKVSKNEITVIGPGLSEILPETFWAKYLQNENIRLIIDGSGLGQLYAHKELFSQNKVKSLILTPHKAEAEKLLGKSISNVREAALEISRNYNAHVYLKGPGGILVVNRRGKIEEIYLNSRHYELSTGGTGDVLCGVLANFLCRFQDDDLELGIEEGLLTYLHAAQAVVIKNGNNRDFLTPSELIEQLRLFLK